MASYRTSVIEETRLHLGWTRVVTHISMLRKRPLRSKILKTIALGLSSQLSKRNDYAKDFVDVEVLHLQGNLN